MNPFQAKQAFLAGYLSKVAYDKTTSSNEKPEPGQWLKFRPKDLAKPIQTEDLRKANANRHAAEKPKPIINYTPAPAPYSAALAKRQAEDAKKKIPPAKETVVSPKFIEKPVPPKR